MNLYAVDPDELCLICEPRFADGPVLAVVVGTGVQYVGPELQENFYRMAWERFGMPPYVIRGLAEDGLLSSTPLHHACGENICLTLLLMTALSVYSPRCAVF